MLNLCKIRAKSRKNTHNLTISCMKYTNLYRQLMIYGMFAYIDLEKMAWRGFKEERIIGIVD